MLARPSIRPSPSGLDSSSAVSLRVLVPFLALFGVGLSFIAGPPRLPDASLQVPDFLSLEALLHSPRPPLDGAIYVVGMLGWPAWMWLVASLALQLLAVLVERIGAGAAWVGAFRRFADSV